MTLTGPDTRILQIHPTRFCNLRCLHCYSSSGPLERDELHAQVLKGAIRDAWQLGYNVLSVSGGEPLLYGPLPEVCREGKSQGMIVTLVTNGTVLDERRIAALDGAVDAIAISLDGEPKRHNRIRQSPDAFERMEKRMKLVKRWGIPFGFVYTLTRNNVAELEWAADFAVKHGAALLQVHPVEESGRAARDKRMGALNEQETGTAWVVVECLREIHRGRLNIQFDSMTRFGLPAPSEEIAAWKEGLHAGDHLLSEIVSPLVIEDDGAVVPLRYGFPRSLGFGNLRDQGLGAMAAQWVSTRSGAFFDLYRDVLQRIEGSSDRFSNMYQLLVDEAGKRNSGLVSIQ